LFNATNDYKEINMKIKKNIFLFALIICVLFAVAGVSAVDVNDTLSVSDETAEDMDLGISDSEAIFTESNSSEVISSEAVSCENLSSTEENAISRANDLEVLSFVPVDARDGDEISAYFATTKLKTTYGSGETFQVNVFDSKTKMPVAHAKVLLKIYTGKKCKEVTVTANNDGVAIYPISKLSMGTHKIIISSKSSNVKADTIKSSVKISKAALTVSAPRVTNTYKKSQAFKVTVKNKKTGKAIKGVKVIIKVYTGKKYKTYKAKTNSKGLAKFNTKKLSVGKHKVVIKIKGTKKLKAKSAKSSIKIVKSSPATAKPKIKTHFEFWDVDYEYNLDGTFREYVYSVRLCDADGNEIVKEIIVKYNGYQNKKYSNEDIVLTQLTINRYGDYLTVIFEGDDKYEGCSYKLR
jgi:uncharacterized FlaG/YvyC family protein